MHKLKSDSDVKGDLRFINWVDLPLTYQILALHKKRKNIMDENPGSAPQKPKKFVRNSYLKRVKNTLFQTSAALEKPDEKAQD